MKPREYWLTCALAALALMLVLANSALYLSNRSMQARVTARAQYIQQSQAIGTLYQEIAKGLANLALERRDEQLKSLLAEEGFTINPTPANATAADGRNKP
jgi:hypothetical protein